MSIRSFHPSPPARPGARTDGGFTLIELLMSFVLSTVVVGSLFALMSGTRGAAQALEDGLHSMQKDLGAVTLLRQELSRSRLVTIEPDGSGLTYKLPVPAGADGAFVDDAGEILWGVDDPSGIDKDGTLTLRFEAMRTLRESDLDTDLDKDGDRGDLFEIGRLVRVSSKGTTLPFPVLTVILPKGQRLADLDGDGEMDPLFAVDPDRRAVVLNVVRVIGQRHFRIFPVHITAAVAKEFVQPPPPDASQEPTK